MNTQFLRRAAIISAIISATIVSGANNLAQGETYFRGDLKHRPRMSFDGRDTQHIQRVATRVNAQQQPWANAYKALVNLAKNGQTKNHRNSGWKSKNDSYAILYSEQTKNGQIAKAKAFVAWYYLTTQSNPSWHPLPTGSQGSTDAWIRQQINESVQILEQMYDRWPCYKGFKVINRGIVAADALTLNSEAYDFLAALPSAWRPSQSRMNNAADRIATMAADFRFWSFSIAGKTNHDIRVASGLGAAAVSLNRYNKYRWYKPGTWYKRPSGWMKCSLKHLDPRRSKSDLSYQLSAGAYNEGSSYYHYAADLYLPFLFAHNRFLSGQGGLLNHSKVIQGSRWLAELSMPDGRRPAIDNSPFIKDSTPGYWLSRANGATTNASTRRLMLWDWKNASYPGATGRRAVNLMASFDPTNTERQSTQSPGINLGSVKPKRGQAVFRSGWTSDDSYLIVNGEHGDARKRGHAHESVDNGQFTFYAFGDLITVAPGYAGFSQVDKTNKAEHHSIVLVDGKGPKTPKKPLIGDHRARGEDAFLKTGSRTQLNSSLSMVEVTTRYEKTDIRRTIGLVGQRYIFIEDYCQNRRKKTYSSQIHVNAGTAKNRPLTIQGQRVQFETNKKRVPVTVLSQATESLSVSKRATFDAFGENPRGHDAIDYKARGKNVTFLTVVAINPPGTAAP
ncbi:MAG: heparinase II/III family protein, partial [Planctomycetota bacterium]|nr:heparinase II/III family protein [Planctomycetota bacterium]